MSQSHYHPVDPAAGDRRVLAAIAINLGVPVAQIIDGIASGLLTLFANALHNFFDAISRAIAFGARKVARLPAM